MTQQERVVKYIDDFGSISPLEAFKDLGITKLATRVSELRQKGTEIQGNWECATNRYGDKVRYMRYTMR